MLKLWVVFSWFSIAAVFAGSVEDYNPSNGLAYSSLYTGYQQEEAQVQHRFHFSWSAEPFMVLYQVRNVTLDGTRSFSVCVGQIERSPTGRLILRTVRACLYPVQNKKMLAFDMIEPTPPHFIRLLDDNKHGRLQTTMDFQTAYNLFHTEFYRNFASKIMNVSAITLVRNFDAVIIMHLDSTSISNEILPVPGGFLGAKEGRRPSRLLMLSSNYKHIGRDNEHKLSINIIRSNWNLLKFPTSNLVIITQQWADSRLLFCTGDAGSVLYTNDTSTPTPASPPAVHPFAIAVGSADQAYNNGGIVCGRKIYAIAVEDENVE